MKKGLPDVALLSYSSIYSGNLPETFHWNVSERFTSLSLSIQPRRELYPLAASLFRLILSVLYACQTQSCLNPHSILKAKYNPIHELKWALPMSSAQHNAIIWHYLQPWPAHIPIRIIIAHSHKTPYPYGKSTWNNVCEKHMCFSHMCSLVKLCVGIVFKWKRKLCKQRN